MGPETRNCQNCKNDFAIEPEDFQFYEKIKVPPPTWCSECRMIRRMIFRNERKLFRVKDGVSGEMVLSLFPPEAGYTVFNDKYWWDTSKWSALDYGMDVDFNKPFLAQVLELNKRVPKYRTAAINMVNSEYSANADGLKNCYLMFNSNYTEDCGYGNGVDYSKNCYDNSHVQKSELCYGSFWLTKCSLVNFSSQCEDCVSLWFCKDCRGCTNCLGCVGLRNKTNCFFNEQLSKEEYEKRLQEMQLDKWSNLKKLQERAHNFWLKFPTKCMQGTQNINVSGDFIAHSKNVYKGYLIRECEDIKYFQYSQVPSSRDCMDVSLGGAQAELMYEASVCGWRGSNLRFCWECWDDVRDLEYCIYCATGSANLFGCVGIMKRQYCILNKQYSKEEYESLRKKIIDHMNDMPYVDAQGRVYKYGEFFPPELSPFSYNQTIAPEHLPLSKEKAIEFGARWQDASPTEYQTTITASELPDSIVDASEQILEEIIQCEQCRRAFRIIAPELQFLQQIKMPLPRMCVDCRHQARIYQRNRAKFYERQCCCDYKAFNNYMIHDNHSDGRCPNVFFTSYAPDRPEIVYCEACYNSEVA